MKIKKCAENKIRKLLQDKIEIQKEINKEISIYGIGFMNTMWGKSKELNIAVIELKIEILKTIFKIKEEV